MFDPLKGGEGGGSNCTLHSVFCRLKCVEFHLHIAISFWPSLGEMRCLKCCLFDPFVSADIGMQDMRGRGEGGWAGGFPWNAGVTVENVLPADLVFHSLSAPLQYTCCSWQEMVSIRWPLHVHLCLGRRSCILYPNAPGLPPSNCKNSLCAYCPASSSSPALSLAVCRISSLVSNPSAVSAHFPTAVSTRGTVICRPAPARALLQPVSSPAASLPARS